jgi:phosphoribosyl-ATP pyrophosphohydrolase
MSDILTEVFGVIEDRKSTAPRGSYVSFLMGKGEEAILAKIEEEAAEFVTALKRGSKGEGVHEAADLIFHTLVALSHRGIAWEEVLEEFRRRRE